MLPTESRFIKFDYYNPNKGSWENYGRLARLVNQVKSGLNSQSSKQEVPHFQEADKLGEDGC